MNPLKAKVPVSMKARQRAQRRKPERVQTPLSLRPITHNNAANVALSFEGGEEHPAEQKKNTTCILCCEKKPVTKFSEEHVFPKEIGGKLILKDKVCSRCNGQYGDAADSDLVKHVVIKLDRLVCQKKGTSGQRPNPIENNHRVSKEDHTVKDALTDAENPESMATVPKGEKQIAENGLSCSGQVDASVTDKLKEIVQSIGQRQGKANEELEKRRAPESIRAHTEFPVPTTFDIVKYKKGILKIAYELACYWLGKPYLNDPMSKKFRQALKDQRDMSQWEGVNDFNWKIDLIATDSAIPFWDDRPASHLGLLIQSREGLTVYVRIFKAFEGILEISKSPEKYRVEEGKFIEMDTKLDEMKQSTLASAVSIASTLIDPPFADTDTVTSAAWFLSSGRGPLHEACTSSLGPGCGGRMRPRFSCEVRHGE